MIDMLKKKKKQKPVKIERHRYKPYECLSRGQGLLRRYERAHGERQKTGTRVGEEK